ncbi:MAG TPA: TonB-dependent receptor plug domain-containing protein, partial [Longimicrobiaceae bacterium]
MIPSMRRKAARLLLAAAALLGVAAPPLAAQSAGTVQGTVVETGNRRPLAGVRVEVAGGGPGTVTGSTGEYTLANVPAGRVQLRASMLGFSPATATASVAAGQTARADFALVATAVSLDAIVVTGTPGATSRRELGNSIVKLDAEEVIEKTTVSDVTEILQSRTPGVQILSNSGTPGAAADIVVRGAGSLTSVRPVIYVDGIRYSDSSLGNFGASGAGTTAFSTQVTSALSFINPEDIESIEVLKGPAAATLYGAEAAAGVIQVITKKGPRGQQRTQWNVKYEFGRNEIGSDIPDNFTTCTPANIAARTTVGGVPEPTFPGCQGVAVGTVLRQRSPILDDPFGAQGGDLNRLTLSVRG